MVTAQRARELLSLHGHVRPQPATDWSGAFDLPTCVERFYEDIGPADLIVDSYGNAFFFPRLAALWDFQAGYRWNGLNGERIADWDDDWLVIADEGGDPFIVSRSSGVVLHARHGTGIWRPGRLFPDLNTMAACLGYLGAVVHDADDEFTDADCFIRPEHLERAQAGLREFLSRTEDAKYVLEVLGWA